jgi:hypothetical protein
MTRITLAAVGYMRKPNIDDSEGKNEGLRIWTLRKKPLNPSMTNSETDTGLINNRSIRN